MSAASEFIYLDHCATTPIHPEVLDRMYPFFSETYGNASSIHHSMGRYANKSVEEAREKLAQLVTAQTKELTFTSGTTEAINQVLQGVFFHYQHIGKHMITCQTEHPAVLDTCQFLSRLGAKITYLPVDDQGNISLAQLEESIGNETILIAVMYANNETGVVHPIQEIATIAEKHGVLSFCDATQAVGKIPINLQQLPIDLLALSAHKFYGPKGIGALYIRRRTKPIQVGSLLHGGKQEHHLRAGTLNVPGIVGLGASAELASKHLQEESTRLQKLRDALEQTLLKEIPEAFINGYTATRLPHVSNICFPFVKSSELMAALPSLALSSGSACASGSREPSHVLSAMGLQNEVAECSVRISLGISNTSEQLDTAAHLIIKTVREKRSFSPLWQMHLNGIL